jgi:hypothetical protein
VPSVTKVSAPTGTSQGQVLTISGFGFSQNSSNIKVLADDKPCIVIKSTNKMIQCEVQPGTASSNSSYLGPSGLKYELFNLPAFSQDLFTYVQNRATVNDTVTSPLSIGKLNLLETETVNFELDMRTK